MKWKGGRYKQEPKQKEKGTESPETEGVSDLRPSMPEAMGCMLLSSFDFSGVQTPLTQEAQTDLARGPFSV